MPTAAGYQFRLRQPHHLADGSVRRGSGEIKITQIEMFVNGATTAVKRCRTSDDVLLRLHYSAERTIPQPIVGIEIESLGGATVTAPNTRDVGVVPATMSGTGFIEIALANIALLPGTYDIHTSITDFNRAVRVRRPDTDQVFLGYEPVGRSDGSAVGTRHL